MFAKKKKVVIIGAGFVGASTAFVLAMNQVADEIVLVDKNSAKAYGEALDINHGLSFMGQVSVSAGDYSDCADADVIVICAGANRKANETRMDLLRKNAIIVRDISENISRHYSQGVIIVVTNPVDILTYSVQKWTGLPAEKVIGTGTILDTLRYRYLLSKRFAVDIKNIHGYVIGEHGETQVPVWSSTHIAGSRIDEMCFGSCEKMNESDKKAIADEIKSSGMEVIKSKQATHFAISVGINSLVESIIKNRNTVRTVSSVLCGNYGLSDVALSLPAIIGCNGINGIVEMKLSKWEKTALFDSATHIKNCYQESGI